jgi:hypothetical protein
MGNAQYLSALAMKKETMAENRFDQIDSKQQLLHLEKIDPSDLFKTFRIFFFFLRHCRPILPFALCSFNTFSRFRSIVVFFKSYSF